MLRGFVSAGFIFCLLTLTPIKTFAVEGEHVVSANECLSCIAEYRIGYPVYGKGGSLAFILKLNPHLLDKKDVEIGDRIIFPELSETAGFKKGIEKPSGYCLSGSTGKYFVDAKGKVSVKPGKIEAAAPQDKSDSCGHETCKLKLLNKKNDERYSRSFGVYQNVLEATDRNSGAVASWVSNENIYLAGSYQIKKGKWWLGVTGEYHIQKYEVELNSTFTWNEDQPRLLRFSLISDYEKEKWAVGFDLDYNQEAFIFEDNFEVSLREVFMLGVSMRAKYKWLARKEWSSSLGFKLEYPFRGSDDIRPNGALGYIGFIDLKRKKAFGKYDFSTKLYYGLRNFDNSQNDQEERLIGLLFSFTWPEDLKQDWSIEK